MKLSESNLEFEFSQGITAIKFDETEFYQKIFQRLPNAKGVDFIAKSHEIILFVEVKNCKGNESDNRYRIVPDNKKINTAPTMVNVENRESLDIETSKKVAMTLACLVGVHTKPRYQKSDLLKQYSSELIKLDIATGDKAIKVLLFLEGDFASESRSKKMIMSALAISIKKKLMWLNCQVFVEDSDTHNGKWFVATAL